MNSPAQNPSPVYRLADRSVNLNLGSIGRVTSHTVAGLGPFCSLGRDQQFVVSTAHAGLPRPGSGLDARVLRVAECPSLLVIAAVHHTCAYYVIVDLAERAAAAAIKGVYKQGGPLNFALVTDGKPWWSGFYFEAPEQLRDLREAINVSAATAGAPASEWRDRLGLLLLELPARLTEVDPRAAGCLQHTVVLASSARAEHERQLDRLANSFARWRAASP